jgi:hypothetical protein
MEGRGRAGRISLAALLAVWLTMRWGGDRRWIPTAMLYGPKFIYAILCWCWLPVAVSAAGTCLCCWRPGLVVVPIMGFRSWGRMAAFSRMRVITQSARRPGGLAAGDGMLEDVRPDVVAFRSAWRRPPAPLPG